MNDTKYILYIEDDRGLAQVVQKRLQRLGYRIDIANDGLTGLAKVDQERYDIVILDYDLPDKTGLDMLHMITQNESPPPVVMVTAYSDPEMAVQALKNGALDYFVKDSQNYLEYLPTVIEQTLEQQRLIDEKRLAEYNRELLIQELDAFAHTVAHDLKSPLSIIINASMLLSEYNASLDAQTNTLVDHIRLTAKKMFNIIEELLLLANVRQQGDIDIYFHEVNMKSIIEDSLFRLEQLMADMQGEITVPDDLPSAYGYSPWIEEVWVNYISNALKYGGNPPCLEITATIYPEFIEYSVIDNGQGVSPENQERLFTPFVRLHKSEIKREGYGLGLSIVQRIIEQLNGEVGMENMNEDGKGSRFWFRLPHVPPSPN